MTNNEILHAEYIFKKDCPLQPYLQSKIQGRYNQSTFKLVTLITDLRDIIKKEVLYDILNPAIILCDADLEYALNCKALHVKEVKECLLKHLTRVSSFKSEKNPTSKKRTSQESSESPKKLMKIQENVNYTISPLLRIALNTVPFFPYNQHTFTYYEICNYITKYIIYKQNSLIDPNNIKICIVKNDPLGKAFNVNAFHRWQVVRLIQRNIFAVDP